MSDFIEALKNFINAVIDTVSTYVHSGTAFIIDSQLAELVKFCSDETVNIIREVLDIFGR
ncbi:MAG: hypothetical protein IJR33_08475 [Clostridia bacterium]|nr:hypothetical protein [Clostridia bacterium]